jgi:tetratricopeptide (TPR) repeat protein
MSIETKEGLFALMEQIAEEREAARPIVEQLVASGEPLEDIEIPEGWRTAGMVLELCEAATTNDESYPQQSVLLGQIALTIATTLSSGPRIVFRYLQARSWKEIGYADRYLCRYETALRAYMSAEAIFSELHLEYEVARTQLAHAGILFLAYRDEECLALNRTARTVFHNFVDGHQETKCEILSAMVAVRSGQSRFALERFEALLEKLSGTDDLHTLGITYQGLALARRSLGQINDAISAFDHARQIFIAANMPSEVNRAEWGLAAVLLEGGEPGRALPVFARLREDYLKRSMPEEAGEMGLWMIDALVATGEMQTARDVVELIVKEFVNAGLDKKVITALAYLRDLMQMSPDPAPAIRHVRTYFEKLRGQPSLPFLPIELSE